MPARSSRAGLREPLAKLLDGRFYKTLLGMTHLSDCSKKRANLLGDGDHDLS